MEENFDTNLDSLSEADSKRLRDAHKKEMQAQGLIPASDDKQKKEIASTTGAKFKNSWEW
jgi:hypothetical protein